MEGEGEISDGESWERRIEGGGREGEGEGGRDFGQKEGGKERHWVEEGGRKGEGGREGLHDKGSFPPQP